MFSIFNETEEFYIVKFCFFIMIGNRGDILSINDVNA